MTLESTLRLLSAAVLATTMAVGVRARLRAHHAGGNVPRRAEGIALMIGLRGVAGVWAFGFMAWLIDPRWIRWAELPLPGFLRWTGALLLMLSVPLYAWVFHHLGLNLTDTVVVRHQATLIRTGPYRWMRHPLYGFGGLFVTGWMLVTANALVMVAGIAAAALIVARTRIEERFLIERFGDAYRDYMARTGRFFPRIGRSRPALLGSSARR